MMTHYRWPVIFNERLLLWQSSGIFFYSTVIIFICFMLFWRIKYDDDGDDVTKTDFGTKSFIPSRRL